MPMSFLSLPLLLAEGPRGMALASLSLLASLVHAACLSPRSSAVHHPTDTMDTGDMNCKL